MATIKRLMVAACFLILSIIQGKPADSKNILSYQDVVPLLIIGSGPAGLSAAVYGARAHIPTLIISGPQPGGQLTQAWEVENMPGVMKTTGNEIVENLRQQAESFGATFIEDEILSVDFSQQPFIVITKEHGEVKALAVVVATGAAARKLNVPGEDTYWGKGISVCSVCDGFFFRKKDVVVVGGGDAAIEHTTNLVNYANKITVFVRKDKMRAAASGQERIVNHPKVKVIYNKEVKEIIGNGQHVTSIKLRDSSTGKEEECPCDGVFLAIGHNPNTNLFAPWLELSKTGYIHLPSRSQQTSIKGVFAAGDVSDYQFRQAGIAAGSGIQAALEAVDFLREHGLDDQTIKQISLSKLVSIPEKKPIATEEESNTEEETE